MTAVALHKPRPHHVARSIVRVANVSFAIVACVMVLASVVSWLSRDDSFGLFGHKVLVVRSNSMAPTFNSGDAVLVEKVSDASSVDLGDILTFRNATNPSIIVTHRVIAKWSGSDGVFWFTTKGDANNAADVTPLHESNIVGVVSSNIPRAGYVLVGIRRTSTLMAFAFAIGLSRLSLHLARSADSMELTETNNKQQQEGDVS